MTRRWLQYSLATFLALIAVVAFWCSWNLNWAKQRREFLADQKSISPYSPQLISPEAPAPGALWLFGERGISQVSVVIVVNQNDDFANDFDWDSHPLVLKGKRLFPEAEVTSMPVDGALLQEFNHEAEKLMRTIQAAFSTL